jgi:hypothetical protein
MNRFFQSFLILVALVAVGTLMAAYQHAHAQSNGTISTLDQFTSTTSPSSAITQRTYGKLLKITGTYTGLAPLCLTASNILTTTGCSSGAVFPFTSTTNYGVVTNSTTTPIWFKAGAMASSSTAYPTLAVQQSGAGPVATFLGGNFGIGTTTPWAQLSVNPVATNGTAPAFAIGSSTGTSLVVTNAGLVGIGTAAPTQSLEIGNGGSLPAAIIRLNDSNDAQQILFANGGTNRFRIRQNGAGLKFESSSATLGRFFTFTGATLSNGDNGNNAGLSYTTTFNDAANKYYGLIVNPTNTASAAHSGIADFQVGGSSKLFIDVNGNVGVGSTTPYGLLSASGFTTGTPGLVVDALSGFSGNLVDIKLASSTLFFFRHDGVLSATGEVRSGSSALTTAGIRLGNLSGTLQLGGVQGSGATSNSAGAEIDLNNITQASVPGVIQFRTGTASVNNQNEAARLDATGRLGIGTTSPWGQLSASSTSAYPALSIEQKSTGPAAIFTGGNVGIGTTSPGSLLSFGTANGVNFSTATSTFNSTGGIDIENGCFSVNNVCIQTFIQAATAFKQAASYATAAVLSGTPTYNNGTAGVGATLTEVGAGALSVDGASPSLGQRILVKNQADQTQNGVYTVTATGSGIASYILTRATDYNTSNDIYAGTTIPILSGGSTNGDTQWTESTTGTITVGSSNIVFQETASVGGGVTGVSNSDSTLTISPTTGAVVASLNLGHANTWTALQQFTNASSTQQSVTGTLTIGSTASTTINADGKGSITMPSTSVLTLGTTTAGTLKTSSSGVVYADTATGGAASTTAFYSPGPLVQVPVVNGDVLQITAEGWKSSACSAGTTYLVDLNIKHSLFAASTTPVQRGNKAASGSAGL